MIEPSADSPIQTSCIAIDQYAETAPGPFQSCSQSCWRSHRSGSNIVQLPLVVVSRYFVLQIYQTAGVSPSETPNQTREPREQTSFSPKITSLVSGNRRVPAPPPMTMASVLSWRDVLSIVNKEV